MGNIVTCGARRELACKQGATKWAHILFMLTIDHKRVSESGSGSAASHPYFDQRQLKHVLLLPSSVPGHP
jgi:hypothetical protein